MDSSVEPPQNVSPYFQYEYPDSTDISPSQQSYLEQVMSSFETSLYNGDDAYRDMIDMDSFVDFMLIQEVSRNVDAYRLSTFMHKQRDSAGGRLHMGPVWDFNLAFGNADYMSGFLNTGWAFNEETPFWWESLLEDPIFIEALRCRWEALRSDVFSDPSIRSRLAGYETLLFESQERNFQRWSILGEYVWPNYFVGETHAQEMDYLENWLLSRLDWLDSNIPGRCNIGE